MALQVKLLAKSFQEVAVRGEEFVAAFYERLFTLSPEVKPLFEGVDMALQQKKLLGALSLVVENLRRPQVLVEALKELGKRHEGYRVLPEHYPMVGSALLETFAAFLGEKWTPELRDAWAEAYEVITELMLKGYTSPHDA